MTGQYRTRSQSYRQAARQRLEVEGLEHLQEADARRQHDVPAYAALAIAETTKLVLAARGDDAAAHVDRYLWEMCAFARLE